MLAFYRNVESSFPTGGDAFYPVQDLRHYLEQKLRYATPRQWLDDADRHVEYVRLTWEHHDALDEIVGSLPRDHNVHHVASTQPRRWTIKHGVSCLYTRHGRLAMKRAPPGVVVGRLALPLDVEPYTFAFLLRQLLGPFLFYRTACAPSEGARDRLAKWIYKDDGLSYEKLLKLGFQTADDAYAFLCAHGPERYPACLAAGVPPDDSLERLASPGYVEEFKAAGRLVFNSFFPTDLESSAVDRLLALGMTKAAVELWRLCTTATLPASVPEEAFEYFIKLKLISPRRLKFNEPRLCRERNRNAVCVRYCRLLGLTPKVARDGRDDDRNVGPE